MCRLGSWDLSPSVESLFPSLVTKSRRMAWSEAAVGITRPGIVFVVMSDVRFEIVANLHISPAPWKVQLSG